MNRWAADDDVEARQQEVVDYLAASLLNIAEDNNRDILTGFSGVDWFFANLEGEGVLDKVTDLDDELFASDLDFILVE